MIYKLKYHILRWGVKSERNYYLGLDIGTNSVGYAVTDGRFNLLKYKGKSNVGISCV